MLPRRLIVVLAAVGLLGSTVPAYAAVHLHGGEVFDATANRGHGDSAVLNQFVLRISRDGRSLVFEADQIIGVECTSGPTKGNGPSLNVSGGHARIGNDDAFRIVLATNDGGNAPIILSGRFVSSRRLVGFVGFAGGRQDPRCNSQLPLIARLRVRTHYRTQHFSGLTATGARLSFYRTVARRPQVVGLTVSSLTADCADGSTEQKTIDDYLGFDTPIRHGAFSYGDEDDSSEYFTFSGRFSHDAAATGSVGLTGRDDCGVADLRWSAKHVGAGPTVTLVNH